MVHEVPGPDYESTRLALFVTFAPEDGWTRVWGAIMLDHLETIAIITASSGAVAALYGAWVRISLTRTTRIAVQAKPEGLKSMRVNLGLKPSVTIKWEEANDARRASDEEQGPRSLPERRRSA